jgi:hypothetical protein
MALSKVEILAIPRRTAEEVNVPDWNGSVRVKLMTGGERDEVFAGIEQRDGRTDMRVYRSRLVSASVVADDGSPMFTYDEALALDDSQPAALHLLFNASQRINRLRPEDIAAAEGN